ncbi:acyltransferase [Staphylococcus rostri]|uniref:Acetyltransferase n=1 Tax=Staphylococcus rostri TaxID=522262 RepID=A0A2K3YQX0_9STAP|nr:acyltransferase [Staphylococcus rostri]PNZ27999.1 acetyltransferase [Staphylococcus rostri]
MARRLTTIQTEHRNPLWYLYRYIRFTKMFKNTLIIEVTRYVPFVSWKRAIYRHLLKMDIGTQTAFAFKALPDLLYPERIKIGNNVIIGYNATILTHEFVIGALRVGNVTIGDNTLIGANVTILPGVTIGNNVRIGAGSVVSKDVPDHATAYGAPLQIYLKN